MQVAEDGTLTATGTLATTDADATDTPAFTAQTNTAGTYGTFSINTAGAWTYSLNNTAAQVLAAQRSRDVYRHIDNRRRRIR